ncbi:MAG: DNA polymerase/3'-5' exonuclease PolX, partial [Bacteroidota bacterium]
DWRWVRAALDKGIKLSINPDAHDIDGYKYIKYGVLVGQKGGLTAAETVNTLSTQELVNFFAKSRN